MTTKLYLNNLLFTKRDNLTHLGLPIGSTKFIKEYWQLKMKSTINSFYSLNGIGLRQFAMSPLSIAKIYRIYCQPKFLYGLEMIYISQNTLRELNSMQASLVKMNLGLSKFAKSSPLLDALRIESVKHLYHKFKILFVKQLQQIPFTNHLFKYLKEFYSDKNTPLQSFVQQTKEPKSLNKLFIYPI